MSKTKTVTLAGKPVTFGPLMLGQVEIITPIAWKLLKEIGIQEMLQEVGEVDSFMAVHAFMSMNFSKELIGEMSAALAAAWPKYPVDHPDEHLRGKRPSLDMVKGMEITFTELLEANLAFTELIGFERITSKKEGGESGEANPGTSGADSSGTALASSSLQPAGV